MDYDSDYIMTWCGFCREETEHDFGGYVKCTGIELTKRGNNGTSKSVQEENSKEHQLDS